MRALHGLTSVRAKLLAIVAIISGIITIGIAVVVGLHTFTQERERRAELVRSQARVVAMNSSAPMAFGDRGMADDALGALRVVEGIEQATLRGLHGEVIASIDGPGRRDGAGPAAGADVPWPEGLHELPGGYALVLPVADEAGDHGWLQVVWRASSHASAIAAANRPRDCSAMRVASVQPPVSRQTTCSQPWSPASSATGSTSA